jgi:hypothetical protein
MNPIAVIPPDTESPSEFWLWLRLLAHVHHPVVLCIFVGVALVYGIGKVTGLTAARPAAHTRRAFTEPHPRRRAALLSALAVLVVATLAALLLYDQGAAGPALVVAGIGFLLFVLISEFLGTPPLEPVALPADVSIEQIVNWRRTVMDATQEREHTNGTTVHQHN